MEVSKIFQAMVNIQKEVGVISKDSQNVQQGYSFRSIDAVYAELHDLMAKHQVFSIPQVIDSRDEERKTSTGKILVTRIIKIKYVFFHVDGGSVEAIVQGEGNAMDDKASNKAMSAAHKYCLLQAFCIPTSEKKDGDFDSHEMQAPEKPKPEPKSDPKKISEAQRKRLFAIAKSFEISHDVVKDICAKYGYEHSNEISRDDYDKIVQEVNDIGESDGGIDERNQ